MWDPVKQHLTLGYFEQNSVGDYDADLSMRITFNDNPMLRDHAVSDLVDYWGSYTNHLVSEFEKAVLDDISGQ